MSFAQIPRLVLAHLESLYQCFGYDFAPNTWPKVAFTHRQASKIASKTSSWKEACFTRLLTVNDDLVHVACSIRGPSKCRLCSLVPALALTRSFIPHAIRLTPLAAPAFVDFAHT